MPEQEWMAETGLRGFLVSHERVASRRKYRLFACACCRSIWHRLPAEAFREAVDVAEEYADGRATEEELEHVAKSAWARHEAIQKNLSGGERPDLPAYAAALTTVPSADAAADTTDRCATAVIRAVAGLPDPYVAHSFDAYFPTQAQQKEWRTRKAPMVELARHIFGNPHRPVVDRSWLTPTVVCLATAVYEERRLPSGLFDTQRLAVLADALEDAGCDNADLLGHLRGGGDHVRGCWAVDLILGKE